MNKNLNLSVKIPNSILKSTKLDERITENSASELEKLDSNLSVDSRDNTAQRKIRFG